MTNKETLSAYYDNLEHQEAPQPKFAHLRNQMMRVAAEANLSEQLFPENSQVSRIAKTPIIRAIAASRAILPVDSRRVKLARFLHGVRIICHPLLSSFPFLSRVSDSEKLTE